MNPLFAKQANATQNSEEQQVEHPEYTVLIIDDEAEVHRVTELTLKRFRFEGKKFNICMLIQQLKQRKFFSNIRTLH